MNTFNNIDIENTNVDGAAMIKITLGSETVLLTLEDAQAVSECITNMINLGASMDHIDSVFDNWGT